MNAFSQVPPGFRFHPTDEELVDYYLRRKVTSRRIDVDVIRDVDLYKIEPWDLQALCRIGSEEQNEWYFFSHKDKKYPTGTRTNRATVVGFWKATGRDKAIYSKHELIGMRKTLVFYKGRAPSGQKSDWIMHEYRLETDENAAPQEEGWVVCRVFKKRIAATTRKFSEQDSPIWYDDHVSFMPDMDSPKPNAVHHRPHSYCKTEMELQYARSGMQLPPDHYLHLPFLESPKIPIPSFGPVHEISHEKQFQALGTNNFSSAPAINNGDLSNDYVTDWRVLDKFVASQLSHDENDVFSRGEEMNPFMEKHDNNTSASASNQLVDDVWK